METIRKINDDLAIAGQITSEQLKQIAEAGARKVFIIIRDQERFVNIKLRLAIISVDQSESTGGA